MAITIIVTKVVNITMSSQWHTTCISVTCTKSATLEQGLICLLIFRVHITGARAIEA